MVNDVKKEYRTCKELGNYVPLEEINTYKIKTMLSVAKEDLASLNILLENKKFTTSYKIGYDVLHTLCEAFLLLKKIKSRNHKCVFTYICLNQPELDFDWDFFEKIRTKRNGIQYHGTNITRNDWKEIDVQLRLYINTLKEEIKNNIC
ncbi:MAG: hypothetical protein ACMXX9_04705 [Candidatus Woesearchaeota archaeon]